MTAKTIPLTVISNAVGKDEVKAFINKYISKQGMDNYQNAIRLVNEAFAKALDKIAPVTRFLMLSS